MEYWKGLGREEDLKIGGLKCTTSGGGPAFVLLRKHGRLKMGRRVWTESSRYEKEKGDIPGHILAVQLNASKELTDQGYRGEVRSVGEKIKNGIRKSRGENPVRKPGFPARPQEVDN